MPGAVVLPDWVVDAVAEVPGGAHPSYAHGYYERDNAYYQPGTRSPRPRQLQRVAASATCVHTADGA